MRKLCFDFMLMYATANFIAKLLNAVTLFIYAIKNKGIAATLRRFNFPLTGFNVALTQRRLPVVQLCAANNFFTVYKTTVMKTLTNIAAMVFLTMCLLAAQTGFAQQTADQQQKYRIKIVKDENGKQEIIDKTFDSKADMEAYAKENHMEMPQMSELPALPTACKGDMAHDKACDAKMKKIIITESDATGENGHTTLDMSYENFTSEERAQLIQTIINEKGPDAHVLVEIRKQRETNWPDNAQKVEPNQPPTAVNGPAEASTNLSDVKVFPNPSTGQFHIGFNVSKPTDVLLRLSDLNGKEIYSETFNSYSGKFEKEITNTTLSAGTYIMDIQAGNEKRTTKVVTQ